MVTIRPFEDKDRQALLQLELRSGQSDFISPIAETLKQATPGWRCHVIQSEQRIVGFLVLDTDFQLPEYSVDELHIGLRSFMIDARLQGKGYAQEALVALNHCVKAAYPNVSDLILTVNCQNTVAYNCYLKAGFSDTGALYLGGMAGPQHIMRKTIEQ